MNDHESKTIADLLKQSIAPVNQELSRDLWPQMRHRLDQRASERPWFRALFSRGRLSAVPWFDWALLAALVLGVCAFPQSIPIWLYHF